MDRGRMQHRSYGPDDGPELVLSRGHKDSNGLQSGASAAGGGGAAPTLDQVYQQIMSQKNKVQDAGLQLAAPMGAPALNLGMRNPTLEQLLLQNMVNNAQQQQQQPQVLAAPSEEAIAQSMQIMRSTTMENILRTMSGGNDELIFDWGSLPQEKFLEGLTNDMNAIDQAPPDVRAMRRTFTLERILSGAEGDIVGLMRGGQGSNAATPGGPASAGSVGGDEGGPAARGGAGAGAGPSGAPAALHRLAQSSSLQRSSPLHRGGGAGAHDDSAHGAGIHRSGSGLPRMGSGDWRNPKRPKLGSAGKGPGAHEPAAGPARTWSQTLHDLARAAADELGDHEPDAPMHKEGGGGGLGPGRPGLHGHGPSHLRRTGGEDSPRGEHALHQHQQHHLHHGHVKVERGKEGEDDLDQGGHLLHQRQAGKEAVAPGRGGGNGNGNGGAGTQQQQQQQQREREHSDSGLLGMDLNVPSGAGGNGNGGSGALRRASGTSAAAAAAVVERILPTQGGGGGGGGGGGRHTGVMSSPTAVSAYQLSTEAKVLSKAAAEVDKLVKENAMLQQHLDSLLLNIDIMQQENAAMKDMLLQACRSKGIQADINLLNLSLQHHRPSPMPEQQAAQLAAAMLALNDGDVGNTIQSMMALAMMRANDGSEGTLVQAAAAAGAAAGGGGGGGALMSARVLG